jgi:hypothetical protein
MPDLNSPRVEAPYPTIPEVTHAQAVFDYGDHGLFERLRQ